jgi:hypothetical protein
VPGIAGPADRRAQIAAQLGSALGIAGIGHPQREVLRITRPDAAAAGRRRVGQPVSGVRPGSRHSRIVQAAADLARERAKLVAAAPADGAEILAGPAQPQEHVVGLTRPVAAGDRGYAQSRSVNAE